MENLARKEYDLDADKKVKEELQETIELLAYENECDISSIKVSKTFR